MAGSVGDIDPRPGPAGDGDPPVPTTPTNWIIADNDMVSRGHTVRLDDGRQGVITRVSPRGRPVVELASGDLVEVHPMRIASRVR